MSMRTIERSEFIPDYARERVSDARYDEFWRKEQCTKVEKNQSYYVQLYL